MRLIDESESKVLFDRQEHIIRDNSIGMIEKNCKLAILNTLDPIDDYYTAFTILDEQKDEMNFNSNLIGAYLGAIWIFDKENLMLSLLQEHYNQYDYERQAQIKYIEALQAYYRDGYYLNSIKESIRLCEKNNSPYLMLLENNNYNLLKKEELLNRIMRISITREIEDIDIIEPTVFIQHYICQNILCKTQFDSIVCP